METYTELRKPIKSQGTIAVNKTLEEYTGKSASVIRNVLRGETGFSRKQMDLILEGLGKEKTEENYLKFFPTLGITRKDKTEEEIRKAWDAIRKVLGGES